MTPVMPGQDVHADLAGRPALLQEACERALAYLDGLAGRPVAPPERGDATSGDDVRQQHAALARSLFGDLLDDTTGS